MIDPLNETVVSLDDATADCPKRHGKKPHISCLYRWTSAGCRGVVLESIQVGGTRCTSREALARFFQRLTERAQQTVRNRTRETRVTDKQQKLVEEQLDEIGMK